MLHQSRKLTSFWIVNLTLNLLLWGSVQMNPASINLTLANPLSFLKQMANSSLDSKSHWVHIVGGERYRSHPLHQDIVVCLGIPSVISTLREENERENVSWFQFCRTTLILDVRVPQAVYTEIGTVWFNRSTAIWGERESRLISIASSDQGEWERWVGTDQHIVRMQSDLLVQHKRFPDSSLLWLLNQKMKENKYQLRRAGATGELRRAYEVIINLLKGTE